MGTGIQGQEYDLGGERSMATHYYHLQTEVAIHSNKGVLKSTDIYRERLICEPGDSSAGEADTFTCTRFSVQREDGPEVTIPSLEGFSYKVDRKLLDKAGLDEQGQLYGIPEAHFEDRLTTPARSCLSRWGIRSTARSFTTTVTPSMPNLPQKATVSSI